MKKSSSLVIIIPLIIALLVVGSVVLVKYVSPVPKESEAVNIAVPKNIPRLVIPSGKPEAGFEKIQLTQPVSDLRLALDGASDSGNLDLESLEQEAASL